MSQTFDSQKLYDGADQNKHILYFHRGPLENVEK